MTEMSCNILPEVLSGSLLQLQEARRRSLALLQPDACPRPLCTSRVGIMGARVQALEVTFRDLDLASQEADDTGPQMTYIACSAAMQMQHRAMAVMISLREFL